jgi:hypothetical protein
VPARFLTDTERSWLLGFPAELTEADLAAHFTLTDHDRTLVRPAGEARPTGSVSRSSCVRCGWPTPPDEAPDIAAGDPPDISQGEWWESFSAPHP